MTARRHARGDRQVAAARAGQDAALPAVHARRGRGPRRRPRSIDTLADAPRRPRAPGTSSRSTARPGRGCRTASTSCRSAATGSAIGSRHAFAAIGRAGVPRRHGHAATRRVDRLGRDRAPRAAGHRRGARPRASTAAGGASACAVRTRGSSTASDEHRPTRTRSSSPGSPSSDSAPRSLHQLRDVDDFADALAVAELAPATRFARAVRALEYPVGSRDGVDDGAPGTTSHARRLHVCRHPADRWFGAVTAVDDRLLGRVDGPVLDVGCGPGPARARARDRGHRHARHRHLAPRARGRAPTRRAGAGALDLRARSRARSLGNRVAARREHRHRRRPGAAAPPRRGVAARRVAAPSSSSSRPGAAAIGTSCASRHDGEAGPWFAWAEVGVDELEDLARGAGLRVHDIWSDGDRCFAWLDP